MDFFAIFKDRNQRSLLMDVVFYFVVSLFIATILCYLIFWTKNTIQRGEIKKEEAALKTVGTEQQKRYEQEVQIYKKKINDFSSLLKTRGFASNVFAFVKAQTMPQVWFRQFSLDERNNSVQLSGEADGLDVLGRQIAVFEDPANKKYIKSIGALNSSLGESARAQFNLNLVLNPEIFNFINNIPPETETETVASLNAQAATSASASPAQTNPNAAVTTTPAQTPVQNPTTTNPPTTQVAQTTQPTQSTQSTNSAASPQANGGTEQAQPQPQIDASAKDIISFSILSIAGANTSINQPSRIITINVPAGTDVKNLVPMILVSSGASVLPESDISQDFTVPVTYIVTAYDGSFKEYLVKAVVAAKEDVKEKTGQSSLSTLLLIIAGGVALAIVVIAALFIWKKRQSNKIKPINNIL